jgi:flagellar protein FlaG
MSNVPSLPSILIGRGKDLLVSDIPVGTEPIARVMSVPVASSANVVEHTESLRETMADVARRLQDYVAAQQRELRFVRDGATGYIAVDVIDSQTGQLVRRLPGDEFLRIARTFEQRGSVLVNQRA